MKRIEPYILPSLIILLAVTVVILDMSQTFSPRNPVFEGNKAMQNNSYVQAIRDYSKAQKFCETDILARRSLGNAYHSYGWQDEALQEYNNTWQLAVRNAGNAMHNAGRIWASKNNSEEAEKCFRRALFLIPENAQVWFELGEVLQNRGHTQSAQASFNEALRLDPHNKIYQNKLKEILRLNP